MSQPAYPGALPIRDVINQLAEANHHPRHEFWPDSLSLVDHQGIDWMRLAVHRQLTDAYLLALAVSQGGRFVTLDSRVSLHTVPQASPGQLVVLGAIPGDD